MSADYEPVEPLAEVLLFDREQPPAHLPTASPTNQRQELVVREIGRRRVDGDLVIEMSDGTAEIHSTGRTVTRYFDNVPITIR